MFPRARQLPDISAISGYFTNTRVSKMLLSARVLYVAEEQLQKEQDGQDIAIP